ncbi:MAG TPA: glycosyltransferase family 2 protein, partial [Polyangiaceae bacterium]
MLPEISILLPAFDAATTLAAALRSVQRQSESRWECLVVDDGSRDGTLALARAAAQADSRIRVLARSHAGLVSALRAGLAECRAPLVARMDADDLMSRQRLRLQRAALDASPDLSAVGCHVRLFPRAGLREGRLSYERWLTSIDTPEAVQREAFVECPIVHPSLMI